MRTDPRSGASHSSTGEGRPEAGRVDPPVVVLPAVDEGHRHLVAETPLEVGVSRDGDLGVRLPQLGTHLLDQRASVIAEIALRTAVEGDAGGHSNSPSARRRSRPRRRPFCTLPVTVIGSSPTTVIRDGCLKRASRTPQCSRTASANASEAAASAGTTYATTASPVMASSTPI